MPRIKFNDGQEIVFEDLDKIAQAIELEVYDRVAYELGARQVNCFFKDSFQVSYVSGTSVSVAAGTGFQSDGTQTDPEPTKRLLYRATATSKALAAADGANPRIDIVSVKAARATTNTDTRNFKSLVGAFSTTSFDVETDWQADIVVTTGTPSGSPAVPSTPSGYIKIAELAIAAVTGLPSTGGITDKRTVFLHGSSRSEIVTVTAQYTATPMNEMIFADATSGAYSVFLPPAALCTGKIMRVKKKDSSANAVTVDGNASETIDGATTQVIDSQYTCLTLLCDGTGWNLI